MSNHINTKIQSAIEQLYLSTPETIHGVGLGIKTIGGGCTGITGIIFTVDKKLPLSQLAPSEILPKTITIAGIDYPTDIVERPRISAHTCYDVSDPNVARLQPARSGYSALIPFRGGQEIIPFPYGWEDVSTPYNIGTLGGFVVDNDDSKIVGITNAHVAIYDNRMLIASQRDIVQEALDTYNSFEPQPFFVFGDQHPGAITLHDSDNDNTLEYFLAAQYIKRYSPLYNNQLNYVDCALLIMNPNVLNNNSYKVWQPIGNPDNNNFLPFASTAEIDSLLSINTFLYSTGSSSGPKGYGGAASCRLVIDQIDFASTINYGNMPLDFADLIIYRYEDNSDGPSMPGDSGALILADINGIKKIIGLNFAGSSTIGAACRIDRVATAMNIRAWDNSVNVARDSVTPLPSCIQIPTNDTRTNNPMILYNNKKYYQAGFTSNNNCINIT